MCPHCAEEVPDGSKWCASCRSVIGQEASVTAPAAPAGWHPAPGEKRRQRYWDGAVWTDRFNDPAPAPGAQPEPRHLQVDDRFAWGFVGVVALVVVVVAIWPKVPEWAIVVFGLIANGYCAVEDDKRIAAAGYTRFGGIFGTVLAPIYLIFRARRLHHGWWIFAAWVGVLIVGSVAGALITTARERAPLDNAVPPSATWSASYSSTSCEEYDHVMTTAQRDRASDVLLQRLQAKDGGGPDGPADGQVSTFGYSLRDLCAQYPHLVLSKAARAIYKADPGIFLP